MRIDGLRHLESNDVTRDPSFSQADSAEVVALVSLIKKVTYLHAMIPQKTTCDMVPGDVDGQMGTYGLVSMLRNLLVKTD